jgi:hypothetical protein
LFEEFEELACSIAARSRFNASRSIACGVQGSMLRVQLPAAFKVQCFAFLLRSSQLRFKAYRSIAAR